MYNATSYTGTNGAVGAPSAHTNPPPTTTVSTVDNIGGLSGRLIHGGDGSEAFATFYNLSGVTMNAPSLTFTKPASVADTEKTGTCTFLVHNIPPGRPFFDLEMTFLRPVVGSVQKTFKVRLSIPHWNNGLASLQEYHGTIDVPAAYPMATTQLVTWSAGGEPVHTSDGDVRDLPYFIEPQESYSLASTQPVHLVLSTEDTMDEKVHILSFRFTFY